MRARPRSRRGERGQALIETAVVITVLFTLLSGVYGISQYASDQNTAGTASRAGARLGAELGNSTYKASSTPNGCQLVGQGGSGLASDPCVIDFQIVQVVCQIAKTMPFVTSITEIDIYRPLSGGDGSVGDLYDRYANCNPGQHANPAPAYTLGFRTQVHPNEAYIGVSLHYQYKSPTPLVPVNAQPTVYTVIQLAPRFT